MAGGGGGYVSASPAETQQAQLAQTMWSDYKSRYLPIEKHYAAKVTNTNYRRGIQNDMAAAGGMQTASALEARGRKAAFGVGVNPNSGASAEMGRGAGIGAAVGGAVSNENMNVTRQNVAHMGDAVMVGQGVRGAALSGYNEAAGLGNSQAIATQEYNNASDRAVLNAVGTAVGTYAGLGGKFGFGASPKAIPAVASDTKPSPYGFSPNEFGNNKISYDGNSPYVYGRPVGG